jgi:hypothetical protein
VVCEARRPALRRARVSVVGLRRWEILSGFLVERNASIADSLWRDQSRQDRVGYETGGP